MGSNATVIKDNLLIIDGKIEAFGNKAKKEALKNNIEICKSGNKLVAPMLVDSHSYLKDPIIGFNDTATTEIYTILFVGSVRCV